ncbi:SGNH hydrolase-type esterase domain-containing protein [Artemisia annua]|uniref:SGNH hydrolase-type esterase domain-containing protein n=1 Tax=Artemisia annua TaxID=35608 RepID=A0A2U1N4N3_ARTAN|nr:SGNH hydrolase-type esterase domain-containing protein [Artemisia annua]
MDSFGFLAEVAQQANVSSPKAVESSKQKETIQFKRKRSRQYLSKVSHVDDAPKKNADESLDAEHVTVEAHTSVETLFTADEEHMVSSSTDPSVPTQTSHEDTDTRRSADASIASGVQDLPADSLEELVICDDDPVSAADKLEQEKIWKEYEQLIFHYNRIRTRLHHDGLLAPKLAATLSSIGKESSSQTFKQDEIEAATVYAASFSPTADDVSIAADTTTTVASSVLDKGKAKVVKEDIPSKKRTRRQMEEDRLGEEAAKLLHDDQQADLARIHEIKVREVELAAARNAQIRMQMDATVAAEVSADVPLVNTSVETPESAYVSATEPSSHHSIYIPAAVPTVYVFGSSIVDVGNNNYLPRSIARANFSHNGIDYPNGISTGRFSNGKNIADFIAAKVGLPTSPPFLSLTGTTPPITGVSFASGGSGILNKTGEYVYVDLMLSTFKGLLKMLYGLDARKMVVSGVWAMGCFPARRKTNSMGECNVEINYWSARYNEGLKIMLQELKSELLDMNYVYFDLYGAMINLFQNAQTYGITEIKAACCGLGNLNADLPCIPISEYCPNRKNYVFWDSLHLTEVVASMFVDILYSGTIEYAVPINMRQLIDVSMV